MPPAQPFLQPGSTAAMPYGQSDSDGLYAQPSKETAAWQPEGHHHNTSHAPPPKRSAMTEPGFVSSSHIEPAISYFSFGATRETMIRSPELHRHVLSTAFDGEAVRQVSQVSTISYPLQGPVDLSAAAIPSGTTASNRSPYLKPLPNRKRSAKGASARSLPGLPAPMRSLAELTGDAVVGSAGSGVHHARRRAAGLSSQATLGHETSHAINTNTTSSSRLSASGDRSGASSLSGVRGSVLSSLYGPQSGQQEPRNHLQPEGAASRDDGEEACSSGSHTDGIRYYYLSRYAPALHVPQGASAVSLAASGGSGAAPEPSAAASAPAGTGAAAPEADSALQGHLEHLLNLHLHDHNRQEPQQPPQQSPQQPPQQQPQQQLQPPHSQQQQQQQPQHAYLSGGHGGSVHLASQLGVAGPLPSLDRSPRAASACSVASAASAASARSNPMATTRLQLRQREHSLADRSASWRRSLAADPGPTSSVRRSPSSQQGRPAAPPMGGTLAEWMRHSVHTVAPEPRPQGRPPPIGSAGGAQTEGGHRHDWATGGAGGGDGTAAEPADGGDGARRHSSGGEGSSSLSRGKLWGRRRGPIHVDPELVRQYTERPPKLCTPNNASRPVTSSDFAAFKNHTVNRSGAANTLRTVLGSNAPPGGAGGAGPGAAAAEARGVTPLTVLLGPSWVHPAMRPRSPHLGVGGVTGSATFVPGLHVPLELDPPPRPQPNTASSPLQQQHGHDFLDGSAPGSSPGPAAGTGAGDRIGTPLTTSTFGGASSVPAPAVAVAAPRAGPPPHVRCGAGELALDVDAWLTPATAPAGELCGLFGGDDGGESVALLSRVVKGAVQCDLGWAEVSESLMFMSTAAISNAVLRFSVPHRAILQRFAATIGGTTILAEAVARSGGGGGIELEEDEEDDDPGPGKMFTKGFGRRNHLPGPGGRAPMLRVPLGRVRGDIFVTISYVVQLESSGNTLSLTHVCNWTPARTGWHLMNRDNMMSSDGGWYGNVPGRRARHKPSDLYDLSFELEILSHRGLNLVSGPRHMTIKPNSDALLIQGYTQVWRPRHVTAVTFELALAVPMRSFAILHDARKGGPEADPDPLTARRAPPSSAAANDPAASSDPPAPPPAAAAGGGTGRDLKLIVPTALAQLNPGGENSNKSIYTLRSTPPVSGAIPDPRPPSDRHCAAVTIVPSSHFSPAELEDVLGADVAPGPRAQAAAIRAGLLGGPGPLPVELWVVVDCCGPAGMAAHLMQLLQTLLVILRSLPATESGGGGGSSSGGVGCGGGGMGGGGAAAAAAAIAAAVLFNVVICPAAPLPPDPDDDEATTAVLPPELAPVRQQQQQQQLQLRLQPQQQQQQHQGTADGGPEPVSQLQPDEGIAVPPVWLFPGGSRPVCPESVEAALVWVDELLVDPGTLIGWAQPVSTLHDLLADMAWSPRPPGCRRAAVLLCQQLQSREAVGEAATSSFAGNSPSARGRGVARERSRRSAARSASRSIPGRTGGSGGGARAGSARGVAGRSRLPDLDSASPSSRPTSQAGSRPTSRQASRPTSRQTSRPVSRNGSRPTSPFRAPSPNSAGVPIGLTTPSDSRKGLSFSDGSPIATWKVSPQPTAAQQQPTPAEHRLVGTKPQTVAADPLDTPTESGNGGGGGGGAKNPSGAAQLSSSPPEVYRPRSSLLRAGQARSAAGGGADGVRWSNGVTTNNPRNRRVGGFGSVGGENGQSDSDPEGAGRSRPALPSPLRSADGVVPSGDDVDDDEKVSTVSTPDPPDVGFPVFVIVHELSPPASSAFTAAGAGAGAVFGANGPSYLLAYQLYQKHLEGLMYEQARDEVEQLPLSYFERLADMHGGFMQVVESPLELTSALVLATSCAVNGRYLRQLRLVARGSVIRDQYPAKLPPALPLSEPLSLLVRLVKMKSGAALELVGVWPNGRQAHMDVSVDPRLRTDGQLLPMLCALSEVSVLLKEVPLVGAPRMSLGGMAPGTTTTVTGTGAIITTVNNGNGANGANSSGGSSNRTASQSLSAAAAATTAAAVAATIAVGGPPVARGTPKQQAARRKATHRALTFNMVTPFTAMALMSMTLASNRGLTIQTLQTTQNRPGDYRHSFVWPAPVMTVLMAAAKDAQAHAGGIASPYHTAATFTTQANQSQVTTAMALMAGGVTPPTSPPTATPASGLTGTSPPPPPAAPAAPPPEDADVALRIPSPSAEGSAPAAAPKAAAAAAASEEGSGSDPMDHRLSDSEPQSSLLARTAPRGPAAGRSKSRRRSIAMLELSGVLAGGGLAARRASALGLPPEVMAAMSPDGGSFQCYNFSGSGSGSQYGGSRRTSALDPHDLPVHTALARQMSMSPPPAKSDASTSITPDQQQPGPASPPLPPQAPPQAPQSSPPPVGVAAPAEGVKPVTGPIGPPLTAAAGAEAHQLTVLARLAVMQQADGSWPAVPELEELVISNGRNLVIPVLGGPKPATQLERSAAEAREARRRESLAAVREQGLHGVVQGPAWSTVLALALLRGKYGTHRLAWIPLETKAFAWLDRKWPSTSACGMSAPAAIMRISALL